MKGIILGILPHFVNTLARMDSVSVVILGFFVRVISMLYG